MGIGSGLGVGFGGGGISLGALVAHMTVDMTGLTTGLQQASSKISQFTTKMNTFMQKHGAGLRHLSVVAGVASTAIAYGISKAVSSYVDFEGAMRKATAVSDVSISQFKEMSAMAEDMSTSLNMPATMTAEGFFHLGQAGLTAAQQMEAFKPAAMMARAGFIDMQSSAQMLVNVIQSFKLEWKDTQHVADVMSQAVVKSTLEFDDLREALKYVGTNAQSTNNSLEDTVAMIALMANVGIRGTVAGTSLRRALTNLQAPTSDVAKVLKAYNIEVYDGAGKMKPFVQLVAEIGEALKGATEQQRNHAFSAIFGIRAISGQLAIFNESKAAIDDMRNSMINADGTMEKITQKQMVAMGQQLGRLTQSIEKFKRSISEGLAPVLLSFTQDGRNAVDGLNDWIKAHAAGAAAITATVGLVSYLTSGMSGAAFAVAGLGAAAKAMGIGLSLLVGYLTVYGVALGVVVGLIAYSIIQHKLLRQQHAELKAEIEDTTDAIKKEEIQWKQYNETLKTTTQGQRVMDAHTEILEKRRKALTALKLVEKETNPDKSWLSRNAPFTSSMVDEYKSSSKEIKDLMKEIGLETSTWNTENIAALKMWAETTLKGMDKVGTKAEETAKRVIKAIETMSNNQTFGETTAELVDAVDLSLSLIEHSLYLTRQEELAALNKIMQDHKERFAEISADYNELVKQEGVTQALEDIKNKYPEVGAAFVAVMSKIDDISLQKISRMKEYLQELRQDMQDLALTWENNMSDAFRSIESSMSSMFETMADGTKSIKDSLTDFLKAINTALLRAATDTIARGIMGTLLGQSGKDAGQTAALTMNSTVTQLNTAATTGLTAAIYASIGSQAAASGASWASIIGNAGASGGLGGAASAGEGWMAAPMNLGGFAKKVVYAATGFMPKGTDTVPAMLTPGERVFSVNDNKAMVAAIREKQVQPNVVTMQVQAIDAQGTYQFLKKNQRQIASMMQSSMQNNHPLRRQS